MALILTLIKSLRRVTSWQLHKLGDILDPQGSYFQPVRDPDKDDEEWILEIITKYQPIPWPQLRVWSALDGNRLRDICNDLIDDSVIAATIKGFVLVREK